MIITTTDQVDGRMIAEYLGLVSVVVLAQFPGGSKWMNSALEKQMAMSSLMKKRRRLARTLSLACAILELAQIMCLLVRQ